MPISIIVNYSYQFAVIIQHLNALLIVLPRFNSNKIKIFFDSIRIIVIATVYTVHTM